jgi:hypothetical protein
VSPWQSPDLPSAKHRRHRPQARLYGALGDASGLALTVGALFPLGAIAQVRKARETDDLTRSCCAGGARLALDVHAGARGFRKLPAVLGDPFEVDRDRASHLALDLLERGFVVIGAFARAIHGTGDARNLNASRTPRAARSGCSRLRAVLRRRD